MSYPPPPPLPPVPLGLITCPHCHGQKVVRNSNGTARNSKMNCPKCNGVGTVPIFPAAPTPLPPPPKKRPINVRSKGQRGERLVVQLLQAVVDNVRSRRGLPPLVLQRNALQAHLGGEDIHGLDGFSVEVKWQEMEYLPAWWRQCLEQATKSAGVPILFYRQSRQKWRVKFRAYVNTPGDRDQVEMDVETNPEDFVEWFGNAYDESLGG